RSPSNSQVPLALSRAATSLPSTFAVAGFPKNSSGELYWYSPDSRKAMVVRLAANSGDVLVIHRPRMESLARSSAPEQPAKRTLQPRASSAEIKVLIGLPPILFIFVARPTTPDPIPRHAGSGLFDHIPVALEFHGRDVITRDFHLLEPGGERLLVRGFH